MSCAVCAGHDSFACPCCSDEVRMLTCLECDGTGYHFHAFDTRTRKSVRCTELAWQMLPYDEDDARDSNQRWCQGVVFVCETCQGMGEVPED